MQASMVAKVAEGADCDDGSGGERGAEVIAEQPNPCFWWGESYSLHVPSEDTNVATDTTEAMFSLSQDK